MRSAYSALLDAAASPDLGAPADGGWDVEHVLAHVLSVDALASAATSSVVAGLRPCFDNRVSLEPANLLRIIADVADRGQLADRVRAQGESLCAALERLTPAEAQVRMPALLVSNDQVVVDDLITVGSLFDSLATIHLPGHTQQIAALRTS